MERKLIEERKLILEDYRHSRALCLGVGLLMALLLAALICAGVGLGAMEISYRQVLAIIWAKFSGNGAQLSQAGAHAAAVVWEIRLPRIICGVFVGAGLAIAGVMFQAILQNPLADPYTLGISTGAAFGASLAIFLNITWGLLLPVPLLALAFALATLAAVIAISLRGGGLVSANLIIAGIIVSAILSAGISFIKMLAGENVSAIVYWLMGSLGSREWGDAA